jgi:hypothetical protein
VEETALLFAADVLCDVLANCTLVARDVGWGGAFASSSVSIGEIFRLDELRTWFGDGKSSIRGCSKDGLYVWSGDELSSPTWPVRKSRGPNNDSRPKPRMRGGAFAGIREVRCC